MFEGVYTAIVTPFKGGALDLRSMERLLDYNVAGGVDGIVPCGTTGESPTLEEGEYREIISLVTDRLKGKGKVIAGAGANSTKNAVKKAGIAKEEGADAILIVTPYYNKPTQRGLFLHYETIAKEVDIPLFIYNVPGRTGVNILPETLQRLSQIKNVAGVKEASGSLIQMAEIRNRCPEDFSILSGDDQLFLPSLSIGGNGIISVAGNVVPLEMSQIYRHYKKGEAASAKEVFLKIFPLTCALFVETNPIPCKAALNLLGYVENELRLPLCPIAEDNLQSLKAVMKKIKLI